MDEYVWEWKEEKVILRPVENQEPNQQLLIQILLIYVRYRVSSYFIVRQRRKVIRKILKYN